MNEDRVITITVSMKILISNNYHLWMKKIQFTAEAFDVWEYVDSDKNTSVSQKRLISSSTDYDVSVITFSESASLTVDTRSINSIKELIEIQRKKLKTDMIMWNRLIKEIIEKKTRLRKIEQNIKISASIYVSFNKQSSSTREIIRTLTTRYKLFEDKIIEQLHEKWRDLKVFSAKVKIEKWITEWKNLRQKMIDSNMIESFDNEIIFVFEFLKVERKWASIFCDNWKIIHNAVDKKIDFFKTIRAYKNAYQIEFSISSFKHVNLATLQEQTQDEQSSSQSKEKDRAIVKTEIIKIEMKSFENENACVIKFIFIKNAFTFVSLSAHQNEKKTNQSETNFEQR
jgi:hypothetical protein